MDALPSPNSGGGAGSDAATAAASAVISVPSMRARSSGKFNVGRRRLKLRFAIVGSVMAVTVAWVALAPYFSGASSSSSVSSASVSQSLRGGGGDAATLSPSTYEYAHAMGGEPAVRRLTEVLYGSENCTAKPDTDLSILGNIVGSKLCKSRTDEECVYCCTDFDGTFGVPVYFLVMLYMFLGLAIICDDYFCESLDAISEALSLSEDVAGATFMAAGSSAPELFTAIVTVLITGGSEGLGTIVGSAIFNIMVIVGVTAMFAGQELKVWWFPLTRDCIVYFISIVLMVVAVADKEVAWWEGLVLVLCYGGYIALMVYNEAIVAKVKKLEAKWASKSLAKSSGGSARAFVPKESASRRGSMEMQTQPVTPAQIAAAARRLARSSMDASSLTDDAKAAARSMIQKDAEKKMLGKNGGVSQAWNANSSDHKSSPGVVAPLEPDSPVASSASSRLLAAMTGGGARSSPKIAPTPSPPVRLVSDAGAAAPGSDDVDGSGGVDISDEAEAGKKTLTTISLDKTADSGSTAAAASPQVSADVPPTPTQLAPRSPGVVPGVDDEDNGAQAGDAVQATTVTATEAATTSTTAAATAVATAATNGATGAAASAAAATAPAPAASTAVAAIASSTPAARAGAGTGAGAGAAGGPKTFGAKGAGAGSSRRGFGGLAGAFGAPKSSGSAKKYATNTNKNSDDEEKKSNPLHKSEYRRVWGGNKDKKKKRKNKRAERKVRVTMKVAVAASRFRAGLMRRRAAAAAGGGGGAGGSKMLAALNRAAAKQEEKKSAPPPQKKKQEEDDDDDDEEEGCLDKFLNIIGWPLSIAMKYTVPACSEDEWKKWYMVTFTMSILWIGVLSYVMVDMASRAGCVIGVPGLVMGLVVLAAGTSVPDALSSILVAKLGQGDMAVANVLGSNVFNILLGLGLPWMVRALADGKPLELPEDEDIVLPVVVLLLYLVFFIAVIAFQKWKLSKTLGVVFIIAHFVFLAWNLLTLLPDPVIKL